MTQMPRQLIILALVLLLWFWPWQLFSGDSPGSWLLSVITMQILFVIACNKITQDGWATVIILIESFCMILNIALMNWAPLVSGIHAQVMPAAFIMELLIITISMRGAVVGRSNSYRLPSIGDHIRSQRGSVLAFSGGEAVAK